MSFWAIFQGKSKRLGTQMVVRIAPVDCAEAAFCQKRDLLELGAIARVVIEEALGRRRQVGEALWQAAGGAGAVHLLQTHVTLERDALPKNSN